MNPKEIWFVITMQDGKIAVIQAGAYLTKAGAEKLAKDLNREYEIKGSSDTSLATVQHLFIVE
ncbi:MAG: hypothetical protein WAU89_17995 [Candidatus Acidiferrales bacterium]